MAKHVHSPARRTGRSVAFVAGRRAEPAVALVHYWLLGQRGGERVLESMCRMFPQADIFTLFYEPGMVSPLIRSRNVVPSFLNPLRKFHRGLLPLMPLAVESFDLRKYDLVISSESGPAKGVITSASTRHFCYCHTPMRYLWELYPAYRNEFGSAFQRIAMRPSQPSCVPGLFNRSPRGWFRRQ